VVVRQDVRVRNVLPFCRTRGLAESAKRFGVERAQVSSDRSPTSLPT
jgi:hypothetical protein